MSDPAAERAFQQEIIDHLTAHGWLLGNTTGYDRERGIYPEDVTGYVKETQPDAWEKFTKIHPRDSDDALLKLVTSLLEKVDPNASPKDMRRYGTLGLLRHPLKDRGVTLRLCQFRPDHDLNPATLASYEANRLRVVPELIYSPHASYKVEGVKGKNWRIDLVLFVNGIPVATLELKSEFKQSAGRAVKQYKFDRLPKDPVTGKPEPLLTFKRGALVHFAVSQFEVAMCTRLAGTSSVFLPFNRGTKDGGAGNEVPEDGSHPTSYLWREVLQRDNLMKILGRFVHLQIEEKEDWQGKKYKKETLIFPRYHQWDLVTLLVDTAADEGPGHCYLAQHSAGSGKSNSIAWAAHQLSSLHTASGSKLFHSVIVITDRTVLDSQLQDTIYQFEHREGVVGRINREEGEGSKSAKLADALIKGQPIIIVTIQTFPFVLEAIQKNATLKKRNFAIIADEAHSSQTGSTARKLREVLMAEQREDGEEISAEDMLDLALEARRGSKNISYFAFTATPKPRTLELFGRRPDPSRPPDADNLPVAFHVYSMRQAIEEGYILDVLRNYTTYGTAYRIAQKNAADAEVDSKKAGKELGIWIKLHPHNIGQRVQVIVEHFRKQVQGLLGGQAKAMVVTSSRVEAVRYKLAFDKYVTRSGYKDLTAMVAFSGEVIDPQSADFPLTERNMNPGLNGRDMRKAFDTGDYQLMIAANKFQTGFDQPKLCAMYVLKPLSGVDCVQTLSRLNRTYPGKEESGTFILDFVNDPDEVLGSFLKYHKTAKLSGVSDPNQVHELFNKLAAEGIYLWSEVEQFATVFFNKKKGDQALTSICKPARDRWQARYRQASADLKRSTAILQRTKQTGDAVLMANAESEQREAKGRKDALDLFKKDLGSFTRFYEFMSLIVDYDDKELEKLNLFGRHLAPLLREEVDPDDAPDLSGVELTHYRLQKQREQDLRLHEAPGDATLSPGTEFGSGRARDKKLELLSQIIARMNDLFAAENLSDSDLLSYANTIVAKIEENTGVMAQVRNNSPEQAMLGDFPKAVEEAVLSSSDAHQELATQYLSSKDRQRGFALLLLEMLSKSA